MLVQLPTEYPKVGYPNKEAVKLDSSPKQRSAADVTSIVVSVTAQLHGPGSVRAMSWFPAKYKLFPSGVPASAPVA